MIDYAYENLFHNDSTKKDLIITFSNGDILTNDDIFSGEFKLTESLCSEEELAFGRCEASCLSFTIVNSGVSHHGDTFTVDLIVNNNSQTPLRIGTYKVQSDKPTADKSRREIEAYDSLYDINNANVANWYNGLTFPMTLKTFRDSFFSYVGVSQNSISLVNDNISIQKTVDAETLSGSRVITSICEINGALGHIGRDGTFKYIVLHDSDTPDYEITTSEYRECVYEDYNVSAITKVQVRQSPNDIGAISGDGNNTLIIEDNFLVYGYDSNALQTVASNLLNAVRYVTYIPAEITVNGNPCVEVGDSISVTTKSNTLEFYVLERTLSGIQSLKDELSAKGTEFRSEEVNGIAKDIIQLRGKSNELVRTVEKTVQQITDLEDGLQSRIETTAGSVASEIVSTSEGEMRSLIEQTENRVDVKIENIQKEIDGESTLYYVDEQPTLTNIPSMDWCTNIPVNNTVQLGNGVQFQYTESDWQRNARALAYDEVHTLSYRFKKTDGIWGWIAIADSDFSTILQKVSELEITDESIQASVSSIEQNTYTKTETTSLISQSASSITTSVSQTYATKTTTNSLASSISQNATNISAKVSKTGGDNSSFGWSLTDSAFSLYSGNKEVFKCNSKGITVNGYATATELSAQTARINTILANYITANQVSANYATIANLSSVSATVNTIASNYITASQVSANYATITNLNTVSQTVNTIASNYITANQVSANYATITNLDTVSQTVNTIKANYINSSNLQSKIASLSYISAKQIFCDIYQVNANSRGYALKPMQASVGGKQLIILGATVTG